MRSDRRRTSAPLLPANAATGSKKPPTPTWPVAPVASIAPADKLYLYIVYIHIFPEFNAQLQPGFGV